MRVFCDFDGTIAKLDTTDLVLTHYGDPAWIQIEDDWKAGRITASQCMRAQIALIQADEAMLNDLLDTVPLDPGFPAFVRWCAANRTPMSIISDGVDHFIERILSRYGLSGLPIISNRLTSNDAGQWRLEQPYAVAGCTAGSGVCKCAATGLGQARTDDFTVFVGDGRSDFCVGGKADLVFARDKLAIHLAETGKPFTPFRNFHEITAALDSLSRDVVAPSRVRAR